MPQFLHVRTGDSSKACLAAHRCGALCSKCLEQHPRGHPCARGIPGPGGAGVDPKGILSGGVQAIALIGLCLPLGAALIPSCPEWGWSVLGRLHGGHGPAPRRTRKKVKGCAWEWKGLAPRISSSRKEPCADEGYEQLAFPEASPDAAPNTPRASAQRIPTLLCGWHRSCPILQVRN